VKKTILNLLAAGAIAASVAACSSNPSVVRVAPPDPTAAAITHVYVPRFEGRPDFVEASTDLFIAELEPRVSVRIVQGQALRPESPDVHSGGNLAPTDLALAAAQAAGAQAVILGKVTSHHGGSTLNGFSTVRVLRVPDGKVLASFHRPSGLLIGHSEHHAVMAAVKRTAEDVAKMLR